MTVLLELSYMCQSIVHDYTCIYKHQPSQMPSSSRSGSSRRSRSGHGHHRHRRRHRTRWKQTERNLIAAILGMVVIAVLIAAVADKKWFKLHGGKCPSEYLGAYEFLTPNILSEVSRKYTSTDCSKLFLQSCYKWLFYMHKD